MELVFTRTALKAIRDIPKREALALTANLETFAADPFAHHPFATVLTGNGVRIRQGNWRAVCDIIESRLIIEVVKVAHRREIYR